MTNAGGLQYQIIAHKSTLFFFQHHLDLFSYSFIFLRWKNSFIKKTNASAQEKEFHVLMFFLKKISTLN